MTMQYCTGCGNQVHSTAASCPTCGAKQTAGDISSSSKTAVALVCFFLGSFGIHRFMVGKIGTGLLMLVTLGCFGIWTLIDFIIILMGNFKDKQGKLVQN